MGELVILFSFLAAVATLAVARVVRLRERREARTRAWIEFLQEDLSASLNH